MIDSIVAFFKRLFGKSDTQTSESNASVPAGSSLTLQRDGNNTQQPNNGAEQEDKGSGMAKAAGAAALIGGAAYLATSGEDETEAEAEVEADDGGDEE